MDSVTEKALQASELLKEMDLAMWLLFVRETPVMADPTLAMVVGEDCTWNSFFVFTREGDRVALVGNFDVDIFERTGRFTEVRSYTQGAREDFLMLLDRYQPDKIAVNFSTSNPSADGLTHGMFTLLQTYLDGTDYSDRLVSAEDFVARLRARKTTTEVDRLTTAAIMAADVWRESLKDIRSGMSEIDIGRVIDNRIHDLGGRPSFPTIVNAGAKTNPGHGHPTGAVLEPGDLLHVDFGVLFEDYCSDIQRLAYVAPRGGGIPEELTRAFQVVAGIIEETARQCRPGVPGHEIDAVARKMLVDAGYDEYQHALGHQLGRSVHDGGALIGPKWERYGKTPTIPLEANNVFTLELEIMLPDIGCVGLEEDVCVTEKGARFLCPRQLELVTLSQ